MSPASATLNLIGAAVLLLSSSTARAQGPVAGEAFPAHLAPLEGTPALALLPLRAAGLDQATRDRLQILVRARIENRRGLRMQPEETTRTLVASAKSFGIDCDLLETSCAARFGQIAAVDYLVVGQATRTHAGQDTTAASGVRVGLDLRLIEVAGATIVARSSVLLPSDGAVQMEALGALMQAFFAEEAAKTQLATVVPSGVLPRQAQILVDGTARGTGESTRPIGGLVAGEHWVEVTHEGHEAVRTLIDVKPGEAFQLRATLKPRSGPTPEPTTTIVTQRAPVWTILPWAVAGVGASLAVAGALVLAAGLVPWVQFQLALSALDRAQGNGASSSDLNGLHQQATTTRAAWTVWGGYAAAGGAAFSVAALALAATGVVWGTVAYATNDDGEASE